ncbi:MAG: DUF2442 domain-containing protein [Anaerolineales bacterium]|nr:DUF2442 domain-containing protein [Anaerolineales bacterium]
MFPRIVSVRHVREYQLKLEFADGLKTVLDFRDKIMGRGGVFESLEEIEFFKQVAVDPEAGTLVWPNEVDLDPDVLYSEASGKPLLIVHKLEQVR